MFALKFRMLMTACLVWACAGAAFAGSISGTVKFQGEAPPMRPIDMGTDPICHAKHPGEPPVNEALILGEGQTMGNIYVRVIKGLPDGKTWPLPQEPAVLTQEGCVYKPHVFVVRLGQQLLVKNPDGTMHNVNGLPEKNKPWNRGMPKELQEIEVKLDQVEDMFPIKCDVHPWMRAYCTVVDHPFFAVTEKDGKFTIEGLPAGDYTIEAWHEKLGTQTATVTVPADGAATQDFTFEYKRKG
ncbi:MAG: carboxypeptidase regulatory-like domain-containing protein [Candidatus Hydrogenedentes bacterium]|nr:carboxypeptidase regulatory-like domain-containing protein [Candidatus Hydrogenedentota bacterium]